MWSQNAREPEFLNMCGWSLEKEKGGRNMFIAGGYGSDMSLNSQIELITRYYKRYNISSNIKIIYRYLPPEVGALII